MANYVYIATSLDGFIATPDGGIEWLEDAPNPSGGDFGFSEFISRVDALLMGRNTFEKVLSFDQWPYSIPVYVLSNTLKSVPDELKERVEIITGNLSVVLSKLSSKNHKDLYIDGGKLIRSFLQEDLIDELIITRFPKLLGKGIPLFEDLNESLEFKHVETEVIEDYLVKSRYRRTKRCAAAGQLRF